MKICAYVQKKYAKATYKNECLDARSFVGLRVIIDAAERSGYEVEWAGIDSVHEYDIVLVSLTAVIDWWSFIEERVKWRKGNYKVFIGGAGVMHCQPFFEYGDFFFLGRGEKTVPHMVQVLDGKAEGIPKSVIDKTTFSPDNKYYMEQTDEPYPYEIISEGLKNGYQEDAIGCNHKCLFCGYTWHRKFNSRENYYSQKGGRTNMADRERAILDIIQGKGEVDFHILRNTAIDGMSERLRFMVNKRITNDGIIKFCKEMCGADCNGHLIRLYNILGYPTETKDDWWEFKETIAKADEQCQKKSEKKWFLLVHSTPFKPLPGTPLACSPISYMNYRGALEKELGDGATKRSIYTGKCIDVSASYGVESLPTQILEAIANRAGENDKDAIQMLAVTKKVWSASTAVKLKTLEKYFDVDYLYQEFTEKTLPSRYVRTYAGVEKMWARPPWKEPYIIKPRG